MKKIVIMSDNHGRVADMIQVLEDNEDADLFIHCGDNEGYDDQLSEFVAVRGNNDWTSDLKDYEIIDFEGYRIGIAHGQYFGYFNKEEAMLEFAKENQLDILCCGHTHMPMNIDIENVKIINPGSTHLPRGGSPASYAVLYIDNEKMNVEFIEMRS